MHGLMSQLNLFFIFYFMLRAMNGSQRKQICEQKPKRKKENPKKLKMKGEENYYFRWKIDMKCALADILR